MGFMDLIKDSLVQGIKGIFSGPSFGEKIVYRIKLELWKAEKRIMRNIMAGFILMMSFAALALAFIFSLIEYAGLTKTLAFLIAGIILLFIGIITKMRR